MKSISMPTVDGVAANRKPSISLGLVCKSAYGGDVALPIEDVRESNAFLQPE